MRTEPNKHIFEPIALVGIACRLPGGDGLEQFWQLLCEGETAIGELPADRLDRDLYFDPVKGKRGRTYTTIGGVVAERPLHLSGLRLSAQDLVDHDPCHLSFCEVAVSAYKDAGLCPANPPEFPTGVYVGHSGGSPLGSELAFATLAEQTADFLRDAPTFQTLPLDVRERVQSRLVEELRRDRPRRRVDGAPNVEANTAAGLVAKALGLSGPHFSVDAACASSLSALALAAHALACGEIEMAIVGGASFNKCDSLILFSQAQSCSANGSHPFGADADGLISSEGYVAIVVKRLSRAIADGNRIHAVIRGIGLSSDGRGRSLWAPRREGQVEALTRAYHESIPPGDVDYIEAHATSTKVGDATELQALADFLGPRTNQPKLPIGSVKSNIGHTLETAGLAGLVKVVLAMQHATIPPTAGLSERNPSIDWDNVPFFIPTDPIPWPEQAHRPRRATVNAFGIGGLNAHLVVEQFSSRHHCRLKAPSQSQSDDVVIIGRGIVVPGAFDVASFAELAASGREELTEATSERWRRHIGVTPNSIVPQHSPTARGGYLRGYTYDWKKHNVPPLQVERANPLQFLLLDAASQALAEAGYDRKSFDRKRAGVVIGAVFGGEFSSQLNVGLRLAEVQRRLQQILRGYGAASNAGTIWSEFEKAILTAWPALLDETGSFTASTLASRLTKTFDLMGGALAIDGGDSSSFAALSSACQLLQNRACDVVLCGAGQRAMDLVGFECMALEGNISERDGLYPGEGVAVLLLKRLDDAHRDGDKILGTVGIRGIPSKSGGEHRYHHSSLARQIGNLQAAQGLVSVIQSTVSENATTETPIVTVARGGATYACSVRPNVPTPTLSAAPAGRPAASQRVALLFPGQGSQYLGMLRGLIVHSPAARQKCRDADEILAAMGSPTFAGMAWSEAADLGGDQWTTQAAMLVANVICLAAIEDLDCSPFCVVGHSFGEFAALVAAGAWSLEEALQATRARVDALSVLEPGATRLLGLQCDVSQARRLIASRRGVFLSHENAPDITVVGGPDRSLRELVDDLAAAAVATYSISTPCAFHTPYLAPAQEEFRRSLDRSALSPPIIPVLSSVTNRFVADPQEIKDNLAQQLVEPVRFVDLVRRLQTEGVNTFIEVGPRQVLSRLVQRTLGSDVTVVALDMPSRPVAESLALIRGALGRISGNAAFGSRRSRLVPSNAEDFDATRRRREAQRRSAEMPTQPVTTSFHVQAIATQQASDSTALNTPAGSPVTSAFSLERWLVDFVIEHTGYPREVVSLDADLEADLGIDSIKKAQMFGELRELVGIGSDGSSLSLDRFRSLRQVLDLAQPPAIAPALHTNETKDVKEQHEHHTVAATTVSKTGLSLERWLIDFVIEHTGYPRDVVGLDADLEADLGIDSIKKAQMLGELRELVGLDAKDGKLSLDEFRTLRQIMMLASNPTRTPADSSSEVSTDSDPRESAGRSGEIRLATSPPLPNSVLQGERGVGFRPGQRSITEATQGSTAVDPAGPEYQLGFEAGRTSAKRIQTWLRAQADGFIGEGRGRATAGGNKPTESQRARLRGLADGAGIHLRNAFACADELLRYADSGLAPSGPGGTPPHPDPLPQEERELNEGSADDSAVSSAVTKQAGQDRVTQRYALRMVALPQAPSSPRQPTFAGRALIIGNNEVAAALSHRLRSANVEATILDPADDPAATVERFQTIWQAGPVPHLFLVMPRDSDAATSWDRSAWRRRRSRCIMTAFRICQVWNQGVNEAGFIDDASLVAVTSLGGRFGFGSEILSAESGALTGLLKAICIENWVNGHRGALVKSIDAGPDESAETIVDAVFHELAVPSHDLEVAWPNGERHVVRAFATPVPEPRRTIATGGNWVCTGGARGITAFVVQELGRRFRPRLQLIGVAPTPSFPDAWRDLYSTDPKQLKIEVMQRAAAEGRNTVKYWQDVEKAIEIDATLRRLHRLGVEAKYHSCDVSDREQLSVVLDSIRKSDGPIDAVLHGAGIGRDARFERKDLNKVEQCISAKADGTLALMDLTRNDPLEFFVAFGSISGRFGANGHTDYSLANDLLAKLVGWYRGQRPEVAAVAFHWHAWGDAGMATKPETKLALEMIDMEFMPAAEGVDHLVSELLAGAPEPEVLITNERYYRVFNPAETRSRESLPPGLTRSSRCGHLPLLNDAKTVATNVIEIELNPTVDPFLVEHRLDDKPILPMVISLELIAEAAAGVLGASRPIRVREIEAVHGLRFSNPSPQAVRIRRTDRGAGIHCELLADVRTRDGQLVERDRVYLRATVEAVDSPGRNHATETSLRSRWERVRYAERGAKVYHGPPLRVVTHISVSGERAWGRISAPALTELAGARRDVDGWIVPSAVLDGCLYATGLLAWKQVEPGPTLPVAIGILEFGRMTFPGESCIVETTLLRREARHAWFAFTLVGCNGDLILRADDYRIAWLAASETRGAA